MSSDTQSNNQQEQVWLTNADPNELLDLVEDQCTNLLRKVRLFAVACCRSILHLVHDRNTRNALDIAERHADGWVNKEEIRTARNSVINTPEQSSEAIRWATNAIREACYTSTCRHAGLVSLLAAGAEARASIESPFWAEWRDYCLSNGDQHTNSAANNALQMTTERTAWARHADLLRDIFGNPFRPIAVDPAWRTETVLGLARTIYEDRGFDRMPLLADALEDAGCADTIILEHCRGITTHVRGCFVVDLLNSKPIGKRRRTSRKQQV